MKRKPKLPVLPKIPKGFNDNLETVAKLLHNRPLGANFKDEWNVSQKEVDELLQYLYDTKMIELKWIREKHTLCFLKKELVN